METSQHDRYAGLMTANEAAAAIRGCLADGDEPTAMRVIWLNPDELVNV